MKTRSIVMSLLFVAAAAHPASAQNDVTVEGQVKVGVHKFKLESGSLYQFEVKAKSFAPSVSVTGVMFPQNTADFKEKNTFRFMFAPPKSQEYGLWIIPQIGFSAPPEGALDYRVTLKTMKVDETPILKKEEKLTADDAKYENKQFFAKRAHHKAYPIKMKTGQLYLIDMIAKKADGNKIDPYLYLENSKKAILAQDDDSGGYPNARIVFRAMADGEYTVIATGLGDALGEYTIMVRTVKEEK